ncbi:T9SS type A sorting domain-containing protein [Rubrivirga sp.]|uniref:T9SS type A sorting domain-containing protein n=1 Tax=Rubrivirga sp. TaxID=1885344 RepID=UPI003B51DC53
MAALALVVPASAQDSYGIGETVTAPAVEDGAITLDGADDEAAWDDALTLDMTQFWNGGYYDCDTSGGEVDVIATAKVLFSEGVLYVHAEVQDYQEFFFGEPGNPWQGDGILVGVDMTHMGDDQTDDGYAGWPGNGPDNGPFTYKISGATDVGITHNWGYDGVFPLDEGWADGQVFVDDDNFVWGVEMAIYDDAVTAGNMIGFNVGGSTASEECYQENEEDGGDANYAFFSWQALSAGSAGGDVMNNSASFATLMFAGGTAAGDGPDAGGAALAAGSPNPFHAGTTFEVTLDAPGHARLAVYDVLGREVAVLADGPRGAGADRVTWTPTGLPAGLYLARLLVDGAPAGTATVQLAR